MHRLKYIAIGALCFSFWACGGEDEVPKGEIVKPAAKVDTAPKIPVAKTVDEIKPTNNFYKRFDIPDTLSTSDLDNLIAFFKTATPEQKDSLRKTIDPLTGRRLLAYAYDASIWGVRLEAKEEVFVDGLTALNLENAQGSFKDNLTGLSLLYQSMLLAKLNADSILNSYLEETIPPTLRITQDFIERPTHLKYPAVFGYQYITQPEFDYLYNPLEIEADSAVTEG